MQSQIEDQKAETVNMKAKIEKKESETEALKQSLENKDVWSRSTNSFHS